MNGPILAFDVGVNLGVAFGAANEIPESFSLRLKKPREDGDVAGAALAAWLNQELPKRKPALIFKEAPVHLGAFAVMGNSESTVRLTHGLHYVIEIAAVAHQIPWEEKAVATIRKHFLGRSGAGERSATKRLVLQRCKLLKYLPEDCADDNIADACAAWDFAVANIARSAPRVLHMFGEEASAA